MSLLSAHAAFRQASRPFCAPKRTFAELRPARISLLLHYVHRSDPIPALPRLREADEACPHNSEAWRASRAGRFLLCSLQPCRDERAGTGRLALSPFRCHKPACEAPLLLLKRLEFLSTIEGALRPITLAWPAAGLVIGLAGQPWRTACGRTPDKRNRSVKIAKEKAPLRREIRLSDAGGAGGLGSSRNILIVYKAASIGSQS